MGCMHPLIALYNKNTRKPKIIGQYNPSEPTPFIRKIWNKISRPIKQGYEIKLPCGRCVACRIDRSKQWAMRCMHEAQMHQHNCFVTLTYSPEHLPNPPVLHKSDLQCFIKRLRKALHPTKIRYYACGEYGEKSERPHFHLIIFGYDFPDKFLWQRAKTGEQYYRSKLLEKIWDQGQSIIGDVTYQSAAYTARYVMKKKFGNTEFKDDAYKRINLDTGEIYQLTPEFNTMSLKPAIGKAWFDQYHSDLYPHDYAVQDAKKHKIPRYYDKLLQLQDPELAATLKEQRTKRAELKQDDNTPDRLLIKEKVLLSKICKLIRNVE